MVGQVENVVKCLPVDHMVTMMESELERTLLSVGVHRIAVFLGWSPPQTTQPNPFRVLFQAN